MKNLLLLTTSLALLIFSPLNAAQSKTTKEVWLSYTGTNFCQEKFCADGIPAKPLEDALNFYKAHQDTIKNNNYIGIIDFTKNSVEKRLFVLNLKNGSVEKLLVAHGKNSEGALGVAEYFSNKDNSYMSSLGFYRTATYEYEGDHGASLVLYGLSKSNSNAFDRAIVLHGANYVSDWFIEFKGRLGQSLGCPAVSLDKIKGLIEKIKGSGLLYIYSNKPSLD